MKDFYCNRVKGVQDRNQQDLVLWERVINLRLKTTMMEVQIAVLSPSSTPGQLLLEKAGPSWPSPSSCRGKVGNGLILSCSCHSLGQFPTNSHDQLDMHLLAWPLLQASLSFTNFQISGGGAVLAGKRLGNCYR